MTGDDKRPTEPPQFNWNESTHAAIKGAKEFSGPLLNDHVELNRRLKASKYILQFEDGYWYFCPDPTRGAFQPHELRDIADELDLLNAAEDRVNMNAIEAMIHCLQNIKPVAEDGEISTVRVWDRDGEPHWIAWEEFDGDGATPKCKSQSSMPFSKWGEPYRKDAL